jgi:outer membrane protein, heavy metal efflux system
MAISPGRTCVLLTPLLLAACASVPTERGRSAVVDQLATRSGTAVELARPGPGELDDALRARLAQPLSADDAVEIAWQNSPRSKAALARLGLASADLFDSRRPRNPELSLGRIGSGDHRETAVGLHLVITDLLTLPARRRIGQAQWQIAVADTVDALLEEATEVRGAYYTYLAAEQIAAMRAAVAEAAELSAEMARRFHAAGNISALQLAREEANESATRNQAAQARVGRLAARMALAERLGLAGRSNRWQVPDQLPLPADASFSADELLHLARAQRPALPASPPALDLGGREATLARRTGWLGDVGLEFEREREGGESRRGAGIELELPIFSQGQGRVARAEAGRELALQQGELIELGIERDVRTGIARLTTQREIIDAYRTALIPQRQSIVARELERYNFMLIGVFELLDAKRQEFDTYQDYLEAIRDYWIAHSELERAIGGRLPRSGELELTPRAEDIVAPPSPEGAHDHHHHH